MSLNGWQRIGVVLFVVWFLAGTFSGVTARSQELPSQAPQVNTEKQTELREEGTEFWPPFLGYRLKIPAMRAIKKVKIPSRRVHCAIIRSFFGVRFLVFAGFEVGCPLTPYLMSAASSTVNLRMKAARERVGWCGRRCQRFGGIGRRRVGTLAFSCRSGALSTLRPERRPPASRTAAVVVGSSRRPFSRS
jgi:hypothetical protein